MTLQSELAAVLETARRAQQLEDEQDAAAAAEALFSASTSLSYLLDLHLERGTPLSELCAGLKQTYDERLELLKLRLAAAEGAQWVQLEQPGDAAAGAGGGAGNLVLRPPPCPAPTVSSYGAAATRLDAQGLSAYGGGQGGGAMHCQQLLGTEGCGAYSSMQADDAAQTPPEEQHSTCAALELLRMCQRTVTGSLDDVVGLEELKEEIEEAVFLPLQHPYLFKGLCQPARTFLLYGPPGTGKTLLVEKVAAEAGFTLLAISPSMILSKWAGDSEKAVSQAFDLARTMQPSILFLDEVDSLGQSRGDAADTSARRLLTELLIQFNRIADDEGVYVFAATNRMQDCDPALLRRFSRRICVPLPGAQQRRAFFAAALARPEMSAELAAGDLDLLAQQTDGYSGSDLAAICRLAAMAPVRELFAARRRQQHQRPDGRARKRQRHSSSAAPSTAVGGEAEQPPPQGLEADGSAAGGSASDSGGAAPAAAAAAAAAAAGAVLQPRKLRLGDFTGAIAKTRPASADAAGPAG